jgi:phosphoglycerol transferase MdoB-like AlkP superfamily enzyme
MDDGPAWFAPKRFGFGSGPPISWQGWVVTILFLGAVAFISFRFQHEPVRLIASLVPVLAVFLVICAKTTPGGWKWRNGKDD